MWKVISFIFTCCILFFPFTSYASIQRISVEGSEELKYSTVFSIYQDELGAVWFNTNGGLIRYNGNNFRYAGKQLSLKPICGDGEGSIFMQTSSSFIEYIVEENRYEKINLPKELNAKNLVFTVGKEGLWMVSDTKLFIRKGKKFFKFIELSDPDIRITCFMECQNGDLIFGTEKDGVYKVDQEKQVVRLIPVKSEVSALFQDSKQNVWIGTWSEGAYCINSQGSIEQFTTEGKRSHRGLSHNFVRSFCEDSNGNVWMATMDGISIYDIHTGEISFMWLPKDAPQQSVWSLLKDKQGGIWIGTFYGGAYYYSPNAGLFKSLKINSGDQEYLKMISTIAEDKRGDLWIGSDGSGLLYYKSKQESLQAIPNPWSNKVKSVYYDKAHDVLWVGTHMGGLNCYNIRNKSWKHYQISGQTFDLKQEVINDIGPYKDKLFVGTQNGVYLFDPSTGKASQTKNLSSHNQLIYSLHVKEDDLWIGGRRLMRYDIATDRVEYYQIPGSKTYITEVVSFFEDHNRQLWATTIGGGFFFLEGDDRNFNSQSIGLGNNFAHSMNQVNENVLIVGTNRGVSLYDKENDICTNYDESNGFPLHSMRSGYIFKRRNGDLLLGGVDGIAVFNAASLPEMTHLPDIRFDRLWINNKEVEPLAEGSPLSKIISLSSDLRLTYKQNMISLEVATSRFSQAAAFYYEYRLPGLTDEWMPFKLDQAISYNNLSPGDYQLQVRVTSKAAKILSEPISLHVVITPPWYAAWYAYLFYILFILGIIFWVLYYFWQKMMFRARLKQQELASKSKFRFFTQISHEFRTPLTLIIGQLEMLLQESRLSSNLNQRLNNTYRHAIKMKELVSQLLDFEKQSQGYLTLHVKEHDIVGFLREITLSFTQHAVSRDITLDFITEVEEQRLYFDALQLQKVFYNLINNALKFTPKEKCIFVRLRLAENTVEVSVEDQGIGISSRSLERIFDDFYQERNDMPDHFHSQGTGIGLSIVKGVTELHHGGVTVESEPGKGSVFTVSLPLGRDWFEGDSSVRLVEDPEKKLPDEAFVVDEQFLREETERHQSRFSSPPVLLLVEDESSLRQMLVEVLSPMYQVIEAADGVEGLSKAQEHQPDIIISDVMMPELDGRELCARLKSDFRFCHIPVILLTAQSSVEQNIAGLKSGADDYITKPFHLSLLVTRCNNLLYSRKTLKDKFQEQMVVTPASITTNKLDEEFLQKVLTVIDQNIEREDLDVSFLCREMAMGKTMLSLKIKGITGQTPGEFILTSRLKNAAAMLKNRPDKSISEIAYDLGFSSPKYFRICFKKQFGVTPSEVRGGGE